MSTKPTREQVRGRDLLAEALARIAEAARLDGRVALGRPEIFEIARGVARGSTAFDLDAIVAIALESRGLALGLRPGTAELLTLVQDQVEPIFLLFRPDDEFREAVANAEAELGEV